MTTTTFLLFQLTEVICGAYWPINILTATIICSKHLDGDDGDEHETPMSDIGLKKVPSSQSSSGQVSSTFLPSSVGSTPRTPFQCCNHGSNECLSSSQPQSAWRDLDGQAIFCSKSGMPCHRICSVEGKCGKDAICKKHEASGRQSTNTLIAGTNILSCIGFFISLTNCASSSSFRFKF